MVFNILRDIFPVLPGWRNASRLISSRIPNSIDSIASQPFRGAATLAVAMLMISLKCVSEMKLLQRTLILATYIYLFGVLVFPLAQSGNVRSVLK
jgi:hypothetical protein